MARVLLVDDDVSFRPMLQAMLERFGHEVVAVENGNEAIASHRARPADLVITDLVMPEKEGLETIRELRAGSPEVRIIAMSGGGRNGPNVYLKVATQLGAATILSKPFSPEELLEAIAVALAG